MLHSFSNMNCLIKGKAVRAHMLPGTGNMVGFAVQKVDSAFITFATEAWVDFVLQLMALYSLLSFLGAPEAFACREEGYSPLEQFASLADSIMPMHDRPDVDSAALRRISGEGKAFSFLTYIFLSHFYKLISPGHLYRSS